MTLLTVSYHSKSLESNCGLNIALPESVLNKENKDNSADVVYLLHGYGVDHTDWQRLGDINGYATKNNVIIVCPDGDNGFYINGPGPFRQYEDHILEVVDFANTVFKTSGTNYIAGLSMGGYGAIRLGLKYPEIFTACASLSGVLDMEHWDLEHRSAIFGEGDINEDYDCMKLALKNNGKTKIFFNCGTEDFLHKGNINFKNFLVKNNIPHVYDEYSGGHTWEYWTTHIWRVLEQLTGKK